MKILKLKLKNVRSFKNETIINFSDNLSVLIGPNGGGKTNILDTLTVVLNHYFFRDIREAPGNDAAGTPFISLQDVFHFGDANHNGVRTFLEKYQGLEQEPQIISIEFKITEEDIVNIRRMKANKQVLSEFEKSHYRGGHRIIGLNLGGVELSVGDTITYEIKDWQTPVLADKRSEAFSNYLSFFNVYDFLVNSYNQSRENGDALERLYPVIQYFSPHRNSSIDRAFVDLPPLNLTELSHTYRNSTSRSSNKASDYILGYLALKKRNYYDNEEMFQNDKEIVVLKSILSNFGYDGIEANVINPQKNHYEVRLKTGGYNLDLGKLSSGEKELIVMVLSIFSYGITNGVVIVDEPELHIHPRWQRGLLDAFRVLQNEKNVQFIIVTHSPFLIDVSNLNGVIRVYKEDFASLVVNYDENRSISAKNLYGALNALTIEKAFFVDKVLLVEGISDRVIYKAILDKEITNKNGPSIEIIDVGGKHNFSKFQEVLTAFNIQNVIIADRDYAIDLKLANDKCLELNEKGLMENLKERGSKDRTSLIGILDKFTWENRDSLTELDYSELNGLNNYLKTKNSNISENCRGALSGEIEMQYRKGIYILKEGELEDYFPVSGKMDIEKALEIRNKIIIGNLATPLEMVSIFRMIIAK